MPPIGLKFESAYISWSQMEGLHSADEWERWSQGKVWCELPPVQEQRHRRSDLVFCSWALAGQVSSTRGCIMTIWMRFPLGVCNLPFFKCFVQLGVSLHPYMNIFFQYMPQTRYLANDGHAMVVRPTGNPSGTRVYEMKWNSVSKSIDVYNPLDGSFITDLPGRWTGRKEIGEADRRFVVSVVDSWRKRCKHIYSATKFARL